MKARSRHTVLKLKKKVHCNTEIRDILVHKAFQQTILRHVLHGYRMPIRKSGPKLKEGMTDSAHTTDTVNTK